MKHLAPPIDSGYRLPLNVSLGEYMPFNGLFMQPGQGKGKFAVR